MPKLIQSSLDAKGLRFAVVAARFNGALVSNLITGALDCLTRHGASDGDVTVIRVPGSFEIPQVVQRLAAARKHDAIVTLGVLLRGETPHFDLIAAEVTRAISETARTTGVPVSFGVLTAETSEQAADRAGGKMGNRGWDAAQAAIEMACLGREIG
jgi:6,7-dimethyl-8-ribityllumazine synthase